MKTVISNSIKKGTPLKLKNGWNATMKDDRRGSIRQLEVQGITLDTSDCYVWEINQAFIDEKWHKLVLTKAQREQKSRIEGFMDNLR